MSQGAWARAGASGGGSLWLRPGSGSGQRLGTVGAIVLARRPRLAAGLVAGVGECRVVEARLLDTGEGCRGDGGGGVAAGALRVGAGSHCPPGTGATMVRSLRRGRRRGRCDAERGEGTRVGNRPAAGDHAGGERLRHRRSVGGRWQRHRRRSGRPTRPEPGQGNGTFAEAHPAHRRRRGGCLWSPEGDQGLAGAALELGAPGRDSPLVDVVRRLARRTRDAHGEETGG